MDLLLAASTALVVVCAPGYPGTTAEAQPTMDAFASAVENRAGWPAGTVAAIYDETEEAGVARIGNAGVAIVPLPFFVKHGEALGLLPRLQAVPIEEGAAEPWTLVAKTGRATKPSDLAGWEIVSLAAYSPAFVRGTALAGFGALPENVTLTPSGQVLSALRKAATGKDVAVLLDAAQAKALPSLPFAKELEVVHRSKPVPTSVVALVGTRLPKEKADALLRALLDLGKSPEGAAALEGMRLTAFVPADAAAIERARKGATR